MTALPDPVSATLAPHRAVIRSHVETEHARWAALRAQAPKPTRLGPRYTGFDVARLLGPALAGIGVYFVEDDDGRRFFVSRSGKHLTRSWLTALIVSALEGHADAVLRESVSGRVFFDHLSDRLDYFPGDPDEIDRTRPSGAVALSEPLARRDRRAREYASEVASARAFLDETRHRLTGSRVVRQDLHAEALAHIAEREGSPIDVADPDGLRWRRPTARTLYRVADREFGGSRRHRRGAAYLVVPGAARVPRLSPRAVQVLRLFGIADPDAFADEVEDAIGDPGPTPEPGPVADVAQALPEAVASSMASAEDPRQALVLLGTFWAERHPETRPAIEAAAHLYADGLGDDLAEAVRHRAATDLAEERARLGA